MKFKTILFWVAVALVTYLILSNPIHAAGSVGGILSGLKHGADAVIAFVQAVFQQ